MKPLGTIFSALICLSHMCAAAKPISVPKLKMNNGRYMPSIGLGTYLGFDDITGIKAPQHNEMKNTVEFAIDIGYRLFDTSPVYKTEEEVGQGIKSKIADGTVSRDDVFVVTKLWNTHHRKELVMEGLLNSINKMDLKYVDLYLMHWPMGLNEDYTFNDIDYMDTWQAMEDMVDGGYTKAIGVSNFNLGQLERLMRECKIKPAALQIEIHLNLMNEMLIQYCTDNDIIVMAYSPMGPLVPRGVTMPPPKIDDPILVEIANKYKKTTPQIALRWLIDRGAVPIPKTLTPNLLEENLNIFDFRLSFNEIDQLNEFNQDKRLNQPTFWQKHRFYPFEKIFRPSRNPFLNL